MRWRYVVARAKERSTWLGIVAFLTGAGLALSPEQTEAIASVGASIGGLVAALWPDPAPIEVVAEEAQGDEMGV